MALINDAFDFATPRFVERAEDCIFYHVIDLPGYSMPDAPWDLRGRFDDYVGHVDLRGKAVLDVGCATGFLSFEAEKRGASVVSFDIGCGEDQDLIPFIQKPYFRDHTNWAAERTLQFEKWKNGYWLAHRLLNSNARAFYGDVYCLPREVGLFDVTIVGAVLEHLRDPIAALTSISRLTEDTLVINTDLLDTKDARARFVGRSNKPDQDYTWWIYSRGLYQEILEILGFRLERITKGRYWFTHREIAAKRFALVAKRVVPLP
jgi:SAM-dependent methyltransferase